MNPDRPPGLRDLPMVVLASTLIALVLLGCLWLLGLTGLPQWMQ